MVGIKELKTINNKQMDKSQKILSDLVVYMKYARYLENQNRRENWIEICMRTADMHAKKYPQLADEIYRVFSLYVAEKKVLPSMRSMQFGGLAIEKNNTRLFNCAYMPVDNIKAFSEAMFNLLSGSGQGISVQKHHVNKLPEIRKPNPNKTKRFVIEDSIVGWADSIKVLMKSYTNGGYSIRFDFGSIRPKGTPLKTSGGKAPGSQPLKECLMKIQGVLDNKENFSKLSTLECHDIMCYIAQAVLAGGIRRSSIISIFSIDDELMTTCKYGNWWELNSQRAMANNSMMVIRHKITKKDFDDLWSKVKEGKGDPAFILSNDKNYGYNPCCFTGDMKVLSPKGYISFKDNVGYLDLINKDDEIVSGEIWSNGIKDVIQLTLTNKVKIKCTPDHRLMDINGNQILAQDSKGVRLMPKYSINKEIDEFVKYGFIQGDGVTGRLNSIFHNGLEVNIGENDDDILELFGVDKIQNKRAYYINGFNDILKKLNFDSRPLPERVLPGGYKTLNKKSKLMFLKGMYSANGCVIKGNRISYKTTSKDLSKSILLELSNFGIKAYITTNKEKVVKFSNGNYTCKESYDVNISEYNSIINFASQIAFVHSYKNNLLEDLILTKAPMVRSICELEKEEVFDFSLNDSKHWGCVMGVIAHNCEASLRESTYCNLTEIPIHDIKDQKDFLERCYAASFIGTLQAGYTDFYYLRDKWRENTEEDALLGVSLTGIASKTYESLNLKEGSACVVNTNKLISEKIGINPAIRTTCIKPSGTSSLVVGSSSGIHAYYAPYYIRRIRVNKNEEVYGYLKSKLPQLLEDDWMHPKETSVISIPVKAPEGSIYRDETSIDLLERIKHIYQEWVLPGHIKGSNTHNISATISIKDDEWDTVRDWMWKNKDYYNGLSILPYNGGNFKQAPFEECTKETYDNLMQYVSQIDLDEVVELSDNVDLQSEGGCSGGACEVK